MKVLLVVLLATAVASQLIAPLITVDEPIPGRYIVKLKVRKINLLNKGRILEHVFKKFITIFIDNILSFSTMAISYSAFNFPGLPLFSVCLILSIHPSHIIFLIKHFTPNSMQIYREMGGGGEGILRPFYKYTTSNFRCWMRKGTPGRRTNNALRWVLLLVYLQFYHKNESDRGQRIQTNI